MRTLATMIRRVIYSAALILMALVHAAEEVPDDKDVGSNAAPEADLIIDPLYFAGLGAQHWLLPAGEYIGHYVIDQPMTRVRSQSVLRARFGYCA